METVLETVIARCRAAMMAHIPVIYIRTDSFELIRQIVDSDELVVRVCGEVPKRFQYLSGRPYSELEQMEEVGLNERISPKNWIHDRKFANSLTWASWEIPHIVTIAADISEKAFPVGTLQRVEEYVQAYENSNCSNRDILQGSALILYSQKVLLPERLLPYAEIIEVKYPEREEICHLLRTITAEYGELLSDEHLDRLCTEFLGFRQNEIANTMRKILTREIPESEIETSEDMQRLYDTKKVREMIHEHKQQKLQGGEVLKLISVDENEEIGGMGQLVGWIQGIADKRLLEDADILRRKYGICPPKGVLVCGIPGCGKSLAAKLAARTFRLPLLQMDVGNLMAGIQGESEENMRKALALAEAMAPCILWIDELEKGFSGASGFGTDSTTFKRMFGTLLGWMQDNQKPCFIFATANDIGGLPKEFFRSGRFDELFAAYLPTAQECADIFLARTKVAMKNAQKHRKAQGMGPLFAESCLARELYLDIVNTCFTDKGTRIVIGADIQKIVNTALISMAEMGEGDVQEEISDREWKKALEQSARECTVYGDGAENIDSIAVGYCRMLRKGMMPTVGEKKVLFDYRDYYAEHEYQPAILHKSDRRFQDPYDEAVYTLLYGMVNKIASEVERTEKEKLIRR